MNLLPARSLRETGTAAILVNGTIADGTVLKRVGLTLVGSATAADVGAYSTSQALALTVALRQNLQF